MENTKNFAPILPFNPTLGEHFPSYDQVTYVQDKDICNDRPIRMESGNIIKYYRYIETKPCAVGGK